MKNPYFGGVDRAIMSSKPSIEQQHDSFNNALMQMSNHLAQNKVGRHKGFINNLAAFAPTMLQGQYAYNKSQKGAEEANAEGITNAIKEQQAYDNLQEKKLHRERQDHWKQRADARAEQRMANDLAYKQQKLGMMQVKNQSIAPQEVLGKEYNPLDKQSFAKNEDIKAGSAKALNTVLRNTNEYNKYRALVKDSTFDPQGTFSAITNPIKDVIGNLVGDKQLIAERTARENLFAELGKMTTSLEADLKKSGPVGVGIIKALGPFYPKATDTPETLSAKLESIKKEIIPKYQTAMLRSKHRVAIDEFDLPNFQEELSEMMPSALTQTDNQPSETEDNTIDFTPKNK